MGEHVSISYINCIFVVCDTLKRPILSLVVCFSRFSERQYDCHDCQMCHFQHKVGAQEGGIENSGFLRLKKGNKKEKRCWFVLKEHVLYLYKASSDPAASSTIPVLGYELDVTGNVSDLYQQSLFNLFISIRTPTCLALFISPFLSVI